MAWFIYIRILSTELITIFVDDARLIAISLSSKKEMWFEKKYCDARLVSKTGFFFVKVSEKVTFSTISVFRRKNTHVYCY